MRDGAHRFPSGMIAEIVKVTTQAKPHSGDPTFDTQVIVTVRFTNAGSDVFDWGEGPNSAVAGPTAILLFGDNRNEARVDWSSDNRLPTRLVPGTSAEWNSMSYMPRVELEKLTFRVKPKYQGADPAWTFTSVEALLE